MSLGGLLEATNKKTVVIKARILGMKDPCKKSQTEYNETLRGAKKYS